MKKVLFIFLLAILALTVLAQPYAHHNSGGSSDTPWVILILNHIASFF